MAAIIEFLRSCRELWVKPAPLEKPWLIDRDGIVYKPERRIVLRAKGHKP